MKMQQSQVDPCLLYLHENGELRLIVTITADDCAISGQPADAKWFMDGLESRFNITRGRNISVIITSGASMKNEKTFC